MGVVLCCVLAHAAAAEALSEADVPAGVFDKVGAQVFQVRTASSAGAPKSSYGSGFAVGPNGLLVTNFHVVSDALFSRGSLQIYVAGLEAQIIRTDVRNDLALLRVPQPFQAWFEIAAETPAQGDRVFSLGLPEDLNMVIVEGTYNGTLNYGPFERIHLSSPINSGMSGGPTVDTRGRVVGVNVSRMTFSANIAFAVPAAHVQALVSGAPPAEAPPIQAILAEVSSKLHEVDAQVTERLLAAGRRRGEPKMGWAMFDAPELLKCWVDTRPDSGAPQVRRVQQHCDLGHSVFVRDGVEAANVRIGTTWFENNGLNGLQFFSLLAAEYAPSAYLPNAQPDDPQRNYSDFRCREAVVAGAGGVAFQTALCARALLDFPDLVDVKFKCMSRSRGGSNVLVRAEFSAVSLSSLQRLVSRLIEEVRYVPPH